MVILDNCLHGDRMVDLCHEASRDPKISWRVGIIAAMEFLIIPLGLILIVSGIKGTQNTFYNLLIGDFSGAGNLFLTWLAIFLIGAIGFYKPLRPISGGLLLLIIIVMVLQDGTVIQDLANQVNSALANPATPLDTSEAANETTGTPIQVETVSGTPLSLDPGTIKTAPLSVNGPVSISGSVTPVDVVVE